jgi:ATP synthase protein I
VVASAGRRRRLVEEDTDPDSRKMLKQSTRFLAVGLEMGIAMLVGVFGGEYLDDRFDTSPVFLILGFIVGFGAAGKAVIDVARYARRVMNDDSTDDSQD